MALARQPPGASVVGHPVENRQRDDEDVGGDARGLDRWDCRQQLRGA
jgi:hypothetical protein